MPRIVPLVLPLSILLASIMTFGNLAENYEFAAMKSSGISLQRAMKYLTAFILFLSLIAFIFSSDILFKSAVSFLFVGTSFIVKDVFYIINFKG